MTKRVFRPMNHEHLAAAREPELLAKSVPLLGELRYYRRFLDEVSTIEDESL